MVHLDGRRRAARRWAGPPRRAVFRPGGSRAIKLAKSKGLRGLHEHHGVQHRITPGTSSRPWTTSTTNSASTAWRSPHGYAYAKAPDQDRFPGRGRRPASLFSKAFRLTGRRKELALQPLPASNLDFLEGKADFQVQPRGGVPLYNPAGLAAPLLPDGRRLRRHTWKELNRKNDPTGTSSAAARTRAADKLHGALRFTSRPRSSRPWTSLRQSLRAMVSPLTSKRQDQQTLRTGGVLHVVFPPPPPRGPPRRRDDGIGLARPRPLFHRAPALGSAGWTAVGRARPR